VESCALRTVGAETKGIELAVKLYFELSLLVK
jgi:hypothetical protein